VSDDPEALRAKLMAAASKTREPVAALDPTARWLPDLDAAVGEAIHASGKTSDSAEQSGVIYKNADGNFAPSIPLQSARHDSFALRAQVSKGQSIAAIWHSHPGNDEFAGYFSPNDLKVADQLRVPSFIRFNSNGAIRRYTPGETRTSKIALPGSRTQITVARGEAVKALPAAMYGESH
jgi:hypothetical protein